VKVARFGISSVVSIIDDELIEEMRAHHCKTNNLVYTAISDKDPDYRANRITAYLNNMQIIVNEQIEVMKRMDFDEASDLYKYFELLPKTAALKLLFEEILKTTDEEKRTALQLHLKQAITAGSIDVNIMAKVDNARYNKKGERLPDEDSDALSSLRGFAQSNLSSSVIISAGYNPKLFSYLEHFADFFPDENGTLRKRIILKVSDYRSAIVQGKILAKKGLWVSEFRIESGLNCGGHAFATDGLLMGPILEEFSLHRKTLYDELFSICYEALNTKNKASFITPPTQKIVAQGGIGTAEEHEFIISYYQLDGAGWGSPFLLVPEATNVDDPTLKLLANAKKEDYYLSNASPLGVPFNNIRNTSSDIQRQERIAKGRPGSPCYKKYLMSNTEFTEKVICTSSRLYQDLKIKQLKSQNLPEEELNRQMADLEAKDCLCEGLTVSARIKNKLHLPHKLTAVTICPGPNLAYFSGVYSLKEMVNHIYGRINLNNALERPHMFVNELQLYIDYLKKQISESSLMVSDKQRKYFEKFKGNLQTGIEYYKSLLPSFSNFKLNTAQLSKLELQLSTILNLVPQPIHI